jgi:hypothetical protein
MKEFLNDQDSLSVKYIFTFRNIQIRQRIHRLLMNTRVETGFEIFSSTAPLCGYEMSDVSKRLRRVH